MQTSANPVNLCKGAQSSEDYFSKQIWKRTPSSAILSDQIPSHKDTRTRTHARVACCGVNLALAGSEGPFNLEDLARVTSWENWLWTNRNRRMYSVQNLQNFAWNHMVLALQLQNAIQRPLVEHRVWKDTAAIQEH